MTDDLQELLERYIERRERDGARLDPTELCPDDPGRRERLAELVARYEALEETLGPVSGDVAGLSRSEPEAEELPTFEGFRTVERLGGGGMGEVFKLEDRRLGRTVAAKVLRRDTAAARAYGDFLREARALALFRDPGIVAIHEFRETDASPVILMEYVEGFELGEIGPSLDLERRVILVAEICEILERAHARGLQHRDLKPSNILVDARLAPKLVDFGLAAGEPDSGHGVGTPGYLAPEQLDPERPIDARTDVYALGAVFYELLCGERPAMAGRGVAQRLPMEIAPEVPEPLQAIALKALEEDPECRYPNMREMAADLRRWSGGRPVRARPSAYRTALAERVRPHLAELREWLELRLIYPHEAERLAEPYRRLEAREDDWILESRRLAFPQITLYLGAWLLLLGGLFYFMAHRVFEAAEGLAGPVIVLGLPFVALTAAAWLLERQERRAVAVAFDLAATAILPTFLILLLHETGFWPVDEGSFFGGVSNRVLQIAAIAAAAWALVLALRTRTVGLATGFVVLLVASTLAIQTDLGLETWLDEGRFDLLALHLAPLLPVLVLLARAAEHVRRPFLGAFLATPLYLGGAVLLVVVLELLSWDGRAFAHLGLSLDRFEPSDVADPTLLETLAAMAVAGLFFYLAGTWLDRGDADPARTARRPAARLLIVLSPFAVLEPIFYLNLAGEYARVFHWLYLGLALTVVLLARYRQRKSFYLAGLGNTGVALLLVADRYEWLDVPTWAIAVVTAGLLALILGLFLEQTERSRRSS